MNNSEKIKKALPLIALTLGIISIIMIFLPAVEVAFFGMTEKCSGLKSVFGYKDFDQYGKKIQIFGFSFGALLPYVFAIGAGILAFLGSKKDNKIYKIVSAVLFLVATILFFSMVDLIVIDKEAFQTPLTDAELELARELFKGYMDVSVGAVLGGICCIFGIIAVVVEMFYDNIIKAFSKN